MTRVYTGDISGVLGQFQETFLLEDYGATITDIKCWKVCGCIVEGGTFCQRCFETEDDHRNVMINPLQASLQGHTIGGNFRITLANFDRFAVPWIERNHAYVRRYIHQVIPEDNGTIHYTIEWVDPLPQHSWFLKVIEDYRFLSQIGYFFQVHNSDVCEFQIEY
jgi:hypothetical protein